MNAPFTQVEQVIDAALESRVFPGAVCEIGTSRGPRWQRPFGRLTFDADANETQLDTIYDLASLTKPVATTTAVFRLLDEHLMRIDDLVSQHCADWSGAQRAETRILDLLEHASGLSARLSAAPPRGAEAFRKLIGALPLEYARRTRSVYSDLGFILLGFCAETAAQRSLEDLAASALADVAGERHAGPDGTGLLTRVPADAFPQVAPTDAMEVDERRGQRLVGAVHDDYAALLGGFAGHAGLFGTAPALGRFACTVLRAARGDDRGRGPLSRSNVALAMTRSTVAGSSRALGWDTMLTTSSCGSRMSSAAFGHTGFTGTSLWIDPVRDLYAILLSNRVCDGGSSEQMQTVRRAFHDAIA